jgi:hypothetical protein
MTTAQLDYSESELLASHDYAAPLVAGGVRCHGGFDADGAYVSPRTRYRRPAIVAWEEKRAEDFGTPRLDIPLDSWPESFPNVAQTKLLLRHGVTEPTVATLTRIGTVEGFGGMLRLLPIPDFSSCFEEEITGTAIAHIGGGLFEAHARDEAGHGDEAGHNIMWFAARDIAFDHPLTEDATAAMLERMGIGSGTRTEADIARMRQAAEAGRVLPPDIDFILEMLVGRMIGLLLIEISAFHGFAWAEAVLSDADLVAGDGEAARLVAHIRQDETPHVDWLRTALSEMRDRTWTGSSGRRHEGAAMIDLMWERAVSDSLLLRRRDNLISTMAEIERATARRADGDDLIDEMLSLGPVRRLSDGTLVDSASDQFLG